MTSFCLVADAQIRSCLLVKTVVVIVMVSVVCRVGSKGNIGCTDASLYPVGPQAKGRG